MDSISMEIQMEQEPVEEQQELHELDIKILTTNSQDICLDDLGNRERIAAVPKQMNLIKLVSQEPAIFNSKHKDYRNIGKKDELWVAMSKQVGWTDSYCKNKWKAIRDQYCRELKRTRANPDLVIKWRYFKYLEFLRPYALSRNYRQKMSTRSNIKEEIPDQEESSTTQEGSIQTTNSKENDITISCMKTEDWNICESSDQLLDNGDITSQIMLQLDQQSDHKFETIEAEEDATQEPQDDEDDDPIHTFLNIESYFEKELITMVHKATVLYNFVHPSYKNAKAKLRVWEEIARKLKKTVRQCRLKWKALRDQYIREHKRLKNMVLVNGKTVPRWKHYDAMSFLEKFVRERCYEYNIVTIGKSEIEIPINDSKHEDMMAIPDSDGNHNNMHHQYIYGDDETTEIYADRLFPSKTTEDPTKSEYSESNGKNEDMLIEEITEVTEAVQPSLNEDSDDEVGAFFKAVAIKIRNAKMSTVAFTELQIDILKTITNALKD